MLLTDQIMSSQHKSHKVKIYICNVDGEEYDTEVSLDMIVEDVRKMAICHFYTSEEAYDYVELGSNCPNELNNCKRYRLVYVKNYQNLTEENSLREENIVDNDKLLLVKCRRVKLRHQVPSTLNFFLPIETEVPVSRDRIILETRHLNSINMEKPDEPSIPLVDFNVAFRRILLTLIAVSARLISVDRNAADSFIQIFKQLEKRHKDKIDRANLKKLIDMGFNEKKAISALLLKKNSSDAITWLLDEANMEDTSSGVENDVLNMNTEEAEKYFLSVPDPAVTVLKEFNKFTYRWFQPDEGALQNLKDIGYGTDISHEILRATFNNEQLAKRFLEGDNTMEMEMNQGYDRDLPIMRAILQSAIIQLALPKAKTLFALMALCINSNSMNYWLRDNDINPLLSDILRIYHAEKYHLSKLFKGTQDSSLESQDPRLTSFRLYERAENPCTNHRRLGISVVDTVTHTSR